MVESFLVGDIIYLPSSSPTVHSHGFMIDGLDDHSQHHTHSPLHPNSHEHLLDDVDLYSEEHLSASKEKVLAILLVVSAALSILGSTTIIVKVLRNRWKQSSTYDRLLVGLSSFDILASISYASTPFLLPHETSTRVWAIGTTRTCSMLGWGQQLAFAAMMYNGMLSYYYLMTIRLQWSKEKIARYEKWMHLGAIVFPLVSATVGAIYGVYHEMDVGFGCWTNNVPGAHRWGFAFGMTPFLFTLGSLSVNHILVYRYVRRTLGRGPRSNLSSVVPRNVGRHSRMSDQSRANGTAVMGSIEGEDDNDNDVIDERDSVEENNDTISRTDDNMDDTLEQEEELRKIRIQEVATQGVLYVGAFIFSYWSPWLIRLLEFAQNPSDSSIYPLLVMMSICLPLQGFLNMLVYNRPKFIRIRKAHPQLSIYTAMKKACFDIHVPTLTVAMSGSNNMNKTLGYANPDRITDFIAENESEVTLPSSNVSAMAATRRATTTTMNGSQSTFFPTLPEAFYNIQVQEVLSTSERSTKVIPFSAVVLPSVYEEADETEDLSREGIEEDSINSDDDEHSRNSDTGKEREVVVTKLDSRLDIGGTDNDDISLLDGK